MSSPTDKAAIRAEKVGQRSGISPEKAAIAAQSAARHALDFIGAAHGRSVAFYMPIRGEISPLPLAAKLRPQGAKLALPHVVSISEPMIFRLWREDDPLAKGYGGIPEPEPSAPEVFPEVVIVPLSAFDRRGFRIGYGKGHYDRTLGLLARHERPLMIGYAFTLQEVEEVPRELHDVPLDAVITENEIIRCNLGREGL